MEDKEIIKALEYCAKQGITSECERCKVKKGCRAELIVNALDLINRQKAEIERLKTEKHFAIQNLTEEIKRLQKGIVKNLDEFASEYDEKIKAEAVKEFAERLLFVDGINNHTFDDCASILVPEEYKKGRYEKTREIRQTVDNLLKERVGDDK